MKTEQIKQAMAFDGSGEIDNLINELRTADDDQMIALLEKIKVAVRKDAVADVLADLKAEGETTAHDLIKENY